MSTCWKCGQSVASGQTECEYGCGKTPPPEPLLPETLEAFEENYCEIDWDSVKSLADLIKVLSVLHEGEGGFLDSPYYFALKKFLHPPRKPDLPDEMEN